MTRDERVIVFSIRAWTRLLEARELIYKAHTDLKVLLSPSADYDALFMQVDAINDAMEALVPADKWQKWAKGAQ